MWRHGAPIAHDAPAEQEHACSNSLVCSIIETRCRSRRSCNMSTSAKAVRICGSSATFLSAVTVTLSSDSEVGSGGVPTRVEGVPRSAGSSSGAGAGSHLFSVNVSSGSARLLDSNARGRRLVLDSHGSSALAAREHRPCSVTATAKRTRFRGRWRVSSDADATFKDGTTGDRRARGGRVLVAAAGRITALIERRGLGAFVQVVCHANRSATGEKAGHSMAHYCLAPRALARVKSLSD